MINEEILIKSIHIPSQPYVSPLDLNPPFLPLSPCAASIFPMMALAQIVSILFLNVFFLFGGFFIAYPNFPIWWKW